MFSRNDRSARAELSPLTSYFCPRDTVQFTAGRHTFSQMPARFVRSEGTLPVSKTEDVSTMRGNICYRVLDAASRRDRRENTPGVRFSARNMQTISITRVYNVDFTGQERENNKSYSDCNLYEMHICMHARRYSSYLPARDALYILKTHLHFNPARNRRSEGLGKNSFHEKLN